ncbi:12524_t:CDS:2, partial [Racocetra persica]
GSLIVILYYQNFNLNADQLHYNSVWGQNNALVGSKIYYTGGVIPNATIWKSVVDFFNTPNQMATQSKEFYYLDVSNNFKPNGIIPWVDLSSSSILPPHSW